MTYYRYPVNKIGITSDFGYREETSSFHYGLDLGWMDYQGEEIYSIGSGEVVDKGYNNISGNYITIKHNEDDVSRYLHLKAASTLAIGTTVFMGTFLGYMGDTGNATGVHLHIEFIRNGTYTDPKTILYIYEDQLVSENTKNNYNVKYYNQIKIFPTLRNTSKDQIQINVEDLNIRKGPGTNYERYTEYAVKDGIYDYYEITENIDYTWYKIGDNAFVASKDNWLIVYPKKDNTLERLLEEKEIEIGLLKETITELQKNKFIYSVTETNYYKIKLNNGEKLIIK